MIAAVARAGNSSNYYENQQCGSPTTNAQSKMGAVIEFLCDPPVLAKYVSLDIDPSSPGVNNPMLQIAEVTVKEYKSEECVTSKKITLSSNCINHNNSNMFYRFMAH